MRRSIFFAALAAVTLAGCGRGDGGGSPSREQAQALLSDFFNLAQTRDGTAFCNDKRVFSADMCQNHWESAGGPDSVPTEEPEVLGTKEDNDLLALRVCGTDGMGRPYQGDFVVERLDDRITVPLPVFWEGIDYSGTYDEENPPLAGARSTPKQRVGCP
jgi:hypothetical protein